MGEKKLDYTSIADYLAFETSSEFKHEFRNGEIVAMSGGTVNQGTVIGNTYVALDKRTDAKGCRTFNSEVRVYFQKYEEFCYPDTYVVCGELQFSEYDKNSIANPCLLIEVLSPSTEAYDRGEKFLKYRSIKSFKEYVLISPDKVCIEVHYKQDDTVWYFNTYLKMEEQVYLRSIDEQILVSEFYRNIVF